MKFKNKIVGSPAEQYVIKYHKLGMSAYAISNKLSRDHNFPISHPTVRKYIDEVLLSDEEIQEAISDQLLNHKASVREVSYNIPKSLQKMIDRKSVLLDKLDNMIECMEKEFNLDGKSDDKTRKLMTNQDRLRFYDQLRKNIDTIHSIQNYQDQYIVKYNIQKLLNEFSIRLLDAVFTIVIPNLRPDEKESTVETLRIEFIQLLNEFKLSME